MDKWQIVYKPTRELIQRSIDLDQLVYNDEEDICDMEKSMSWANKNEMLYTFLLYGNKLVGYINFMPVTDECYNKFRHGKIKDGKIAADDITQFSKAKPNKCILISIVIHPDFQNGVALMYLCKGFYRKLKEFNQNGITISSVVADCVSTMGEKCAIKCFNAKHVSNSSNGKIYEGKIVI